MKNLLFLLMLAVLVLMPALFNADAEQAMTSGPPISQPLVREGTLAMRLAEALNVGSAANEAEAESSLSTAGIAPRNGWIADYPVTPDIAAELQAAVGEAAESGRITSGREAALKTFHDVINEYNLPVKGDTSAQGYAQRAPDYSDPAAINSYYYDEGPPIVTYYAPPPYYGYLYSWVPYPFWWWDFWFPGFYVLTDFDFHGHHHDHDGHHDGHHDGQFHDDHFSNHFRDHGTGKMSRIDPVNRARGGTLPVTGGTGWTSPAARNGARGIVNSSNNFATARTGGSGRPVSTPGKSWASGSSSSQRTFGSSAAPKAALSGTQTGRTYGNSRYDSPYYDSYRRGSFSRAAYRTPSSFGQPSAGSRFYSSPSSGGRSFKGPSGSGAAFSRPSVGSRSFSSPGGKSSFGGSSRGFSGGTRR